MTGKNSLGINNGNSSTTQNLSGVFDMNGGAWEQTAGFLRSVPGYDGSDLLKLQEITSSTKHYSVYRSYETETPYGQYYVNLGRFGEAIFETSDDGLNPGWCGDEGSFADKPNPFLIRRWICRTFGS